MENKYKVLLRVDVNEFGNISSDWQELQSFNSYIKAREKCLELCLDGELEREESGKEGFFGVKGEDKWRCRLIKTN